MQHTALYKAVKRGDSIEVRRLLSAGVDPNSALGFDTPLSAAAARGNTPDNHIAAGSWSEARRVRGSGCGIRQSCQGCAASIGNWWAKRWATRTATEHVEVVGVYS